MIAYLIIMREPQPREKIADLIWDSDSTKSVLNNLRQLLSRTLKNTIDELHIKRKTLVFEPHSETYVDLYQLEEALAADDIPNLDAALQLYKGDLLADFYLYDAPRFNGWLTTKREQVRQRVYDAYRRVCEYYAAEQQIDLLIEAARRWLALDDLMEDAHYWLIYALKESDQMQAAMGSYQSYVQIMADELTLEPSASMQALRDEIQTTRQPVTSLKKPSPVVVSSQRPVYKWGEAPHARQFYGRQTEQRLLTRWLTTDQAYLVSILGIGGQGKTTLAAAVSRSVADQFDGVFWRSVLNGPPLHAILPDYLGYVSYNQEMIPAELPEQLELLRRYLQSGRHLLVLDNLETILDAEHTGRFREGYEPYEQLLHLFAQGGHQSSLLLTSRESPAILSRLNYQSDKTFELQLRGLSSQASRMVLSTTELELTAQQLDTLNASYSGHPLALKMAAQTIQDFYFGDVQTFLDDKTFILADIYDVLEQQMARLTKLELDILLWLTIHREAIRPQELATHFVNVTRPRPLLEAMKRLQRRSLLERQAHGFTLQNVMTEYVTDYFVRLGCEEIVSGRFDLLDSHALMLAHTKEYIRQQQLRMIIRPLANELLLAFGSEEAIAKRIHQLLEQIRQNSQKYQGYVVGNLLNLLLFLEIDIRGYDFSHLMIRQAYLRGAVLKETNFRYADFSQPVFTGTFGIIFTVAYSPDGQYIAAGTMAGEIRIRQAADFQPIRTLNGHSGAVYALAFSPDSRTLVSGSADKTVRLWEMDSGRCQNIYEGHAQPVWAVAFHPAGRLIASGGEGMSIHLWDIDTQEMHQLLGHAGQIFTLAFDYNGQQLASAGLDTEIRIWDVHSRETTDILAKHTDTIRSLSYSPDGQTLASGGSDHLIYLWDLKTKQAKQTLKGHTYWIYEIEFTPDGQTLVSSGGDRMVRLWNVRKGETYYSFYASSKWILGLSVSPDGLHLVTAGFERTAHIWNLRTGQLQHLHEGHSIWVEYITFSPDGRTLATCSSDNQIHFWDMDSGTRLDTLSYHTQAVTSIAFSPDGQILASCSYDQTVQLWNLNTQERIHLLEGHKDWVADLSFNAEGTLLATAGHDFLVNIWDVQSGALLYQLQNHTKDVTKLTFGPFGRLLATCNDERIVRIWHIDDILDQVALGHSAGIIPPRHALEGHQDWVYHIAFSPDGQRIVSGSHDQTIRLWDVATGEEQRKFDCQSGWVRSVAYHPYKPFIASGGTDHTVRLWDIEQNELVAELRGHAHWVDAVVFSRDGRWLVSGGGDGVWCIWDVETYECVRVQRLPRPYHGMQIGGAAGLTDSQRETLFELGAID